MVDFSNGVQLVMAYIKNCTDHPTFICCCIG